MTKMFQMLVQKPKRKCSELPHSPFFEIKLLDDSF